MEKPAICMQWGNDEFKANEEILGLHRLESTNASSLVAMIHDVIQWLNLSYSWVCDQYYVVPIQCQELGQQWPIKKLKKGGTMCCLHALLWSLSWTTSDIIKQCKEMQDAMKLIQEIHYVVKKSPHRDVVLHQLKEKLPIIHQECMYCAPEGGS